MTENTQVATGLPKELCDFLNASFQRSGKRTRAVACVSLQGNTTVRFVKLKTRKASGQRKIISKGY
jgi:hypothetical protein